MIAVKAHGKCARSDCGRYSEAIGADQDDAHILLNHEHGHEYRHCFEGQPLFQQVDTNKDTNPKRKQRRAS